MNMLRGVTSLRKNSNSLIYWFSNSQSAYVMSMFLGGGIRGMRTQSENSWANWVEGKKKSKQTLEIIRIQKRDAIKPKLKRKGKASWRQQPLHGILKNRWETEQKGWWKGSPHRGKSAQYLLSTASTYLGLDWAWRTRKEEVRRLQMWLQGKSLRALGTIHEEFIWNCSFFFKDTANLWFRMITLVRVWNIYKRNKTWKQEDQLRSICKKMTVKSKWKWETDLRNRAVSNRIWWCEDKADEPRKNLSFPAWVTDWMVILTPSRLRIFKKKIASDMMF